MKVKMEATEKDHGARDEGTRWFIWYYVYMGDEGAREWRRLWNREYTNSIVIHWYDEMLNYKIKRIKVLLGTWNYINE